MAEIEVLSEVTGSVWKLFVQVGQKVKEDETLMILESMKMEIPLCAPEDGVIKRICAEEGAQISEGDLACVIVV